MQSFISDVRYALRQLRRAPGFAATAILSLALGIGATTAVFSVIRAILLDPYPYKDADRMVHVEIRGEGQSNGRLLLVNGPEYGDLRQVPGIDDVFLQQGGRQALTAESIPLSVDVGVYSTNLFTYMGVPPLLGREFTPADVTGDSPNPVAVLGYLFWKKQYGAQRDVIEKTIELDNKQYTIIGVVPPRFTWGDSEVYLPGAPNSDPHDYWLAFIRMKPGVTRQMLGQQLQPLVTRITQQDPTNFPPHAKPVVVTLNDEAVGKFASVLLALFGAVLLLLLIGCGNASILLLARGTARQHELAVRSSIGATRKRLLRQLLTEAVILSFTGAFAGVLLAYGGLEAIVARLPRQAFPHEASIHINMAVLLFSVALSLLTGILFGISPALQLSKPAITELMQSGSTKLAGTERGRVIHRTLIAAQVALTMLLLSCAAAAIAGFLAMYHTNLGYETRNVFFMDVGAPKGTANTYAARAALQDQILKSTTAAPGIDAAGVSTTWLPPFQGFLAPIEISGKPNLKNPQAMLTLISPTLLSVLKVPLVSGRIFTETENANAAHVALVNRTFAKRFFDGQDPIGHTLKSPQLEVKQPDLFVASNAGDWLQIIGVVDDSRNDGLERPTAPAIYLPYTFVLTPDVSLIVRSHGDPLAAIRSVGETLHSVNKALVIRSPNTLTWVLDEYVWSKERFVATLFSLFAGLALALAATGLYSVVTYSVSQRRREMGLRMALGAQRSNIIQLVLRSALVTVAAGAIAGLTVSLALSRYLTSFTSGTPANPLVLLSVSLLMLAVSAIACTAPAWRAATIDPMKALRTE